MSLRLRLPGLPFLQPGDGRAQQEEMSAPLGLTFSVTHECPERVVEMANTQRIAIGERGNLMFYSLMAPRISGHDMGVASRIKAAVVNGMLSSDVAPDSRTMPTVQDAYRAAMEQLASCRTDERAETIAYIVGHDIAGTGPFSILLEDSKDIEEIEVNSPTSNIMVYHSRHGRCATNLRFNSERDFRFSINRLISATERELNTSSPIIDAQLVDGSRIHAQLRPYAISGCAASIRLNNGKGISIGRLMELGTVSEDVLAYLWMAIESEQNIVIAGAPAAGKTSLMLAVHAFVPPYERVVTVEEDINELKFYSNMVNVVPLQGSSILGRPDIKAQVINALHLRPDRLVIGELRGGEAREVFVGSNLGVPFMTTIHSSANGQAILGRLAAKPMCVEEHTLCMLDMSVFMRQASGSSRLLDSIMEYRWLSRAEISMDDSTGGQLTPVHITEVARGGVLDYRLAKDSKAVAKYCEENMASQAEAITEIRRRAKFLKKMGSGAGIQEAASYISSYMEIK